jgi:hypothetical protein
MIDASTTIQRISYETPHLEEHPAVATCIALGRILHGIGRRSRHLCDRRTVREEQDLDRNGQTSVQNNDHNQQNAGWLCIDGGDDGVSMYLKISTDTTRDGANSSWLERTSF